MHTCEYIIAFDSSSGEAEECEAPAHFMNDLGAWNCAEHYLLMQEDIDARLGSARAKAEDCK